MQCAKTLRMNIPHSSKQFESILSNVDRCEVVKPGNMVATLSTTTEFDAMKFARLVRNAFQRNVVTSRDYYLSIAVLLHEANAGERTEDLLDIAHGFMEEANNNAGNTIKCFVLNK